MNYGMPPISTDDPSLYDEGDYADDGNSNNNDSDSNDSDDD